MSEYNEGDTVEAVKGKRRVIDQVVIAPEGSLFRNSPYLGIPSLFGPSSIASYKEAGYTVTVVERATPPLPTEPGWYLVANEGDTVYLGLDGSWSDALNYGVAPDEIRRKYAPLTRLEQVPVTAKRVLVAVRVFMEARSTPMHDNDVTMFERASFLKDLDMLATQLGVEP